MEAQDQVKEKDQKLLELETNVIDANTEVAKLKDEKKAVEEEFKVKSELNDGLIDEKNELEENLAKVNATMQKMFKERSVMKDIIDKLEHPNSQDDDLVSNETESDLGKKLSEKTKELKA